MRQGSARYIAIGLVAAAGVLLGGGAWGGEKEKPRQISREQAVALMEREAGPSRGAADAQIVMVEFSDFQCGYCRKFALETLPKLDERYIQTGKMRFVYRHMAVLGPPSVQAAQAASCAFEQGKFWEYHDTLFRNKSPLAFGATQLKQYAADLKLDTQAFATCLDSGRYAERVWVETGFGKALGANGTPSFLVNGQLAIGAYPFEAFREAIDAMLTPDQKSPGPDKK
jgi:protein-disulfide isomerase